MQYYVLNIKTILEHLSYSNVRQKILDAALTTNENALFLCQNGELETRLDSNGMLVWIKGYPNPHRFIELQYKAYQDQLNILKHITYV